MLSRLLGGSGGLHQPLKHGLRQINRGKIQNFTEPVRKSAASFNRNNLIASDTRRFKRPTPVRYPSDKRPQTRPMRPRTVQVRSARTSKIFFRPKKPGLPGPTLQTKHLEKTRTGSEPGPAGS